MDAVYTTILPAIDAEARSQAPDTPDHIPTPRTQTPPPQRTLELTIAEEDFPGLRISTLSAMSAMAQTSFSSSRQSGIWPSPQSGLRAAPRLPHLPRPPGSDPGLVYRTCVSTSTFRARTPRTPRRRTSRAGERLMRSASRGRLCIG
jgi:hypothetical protein